MVKSNIQWLFPTVYFSHIRSRSRSWHGFVYFSTRSCLFVRIRAVFPHQFIGNVLTLLLLFKMFIVETLNYANIMSRSINYLFLITSKCEKCKIMQNIAETASLNDNVTSKLRCDVIIEDNFRIS